MKPFTVNSLPADEVWDHVFRHLDSLDEQSIVGFIRMVVSGLPEPCPEESVTC